ncbi:histidine kinase [Algoriphagus sp. Y33]|uniref:histidine kinase n=1 Tax=Algoriphagus sp. Y33 TaxID=2772483 RepID=UPI0017861402|nr:histidine kinase [Algoriphagus sp. Y33]
MKSISKVFSIQFSGTNSRLEWLYSKLKYLFDHPILMIGILWGCYYVFDLGSTDLLQEESMGFTYANANMAAGILSSFVFFYWFFPGLFYRGGFIKAMLLSILSLSLILVSKYYIFLYYDLIQDSVSYFLLEEMLRGVYFMVFTFSIWVFYKFFKSELAKARIEVELESLGIAHNSLQLSPHFMMNLITDIAGRSSRYSHSLFIDLTEFSSILKYTYQDIGELNELATELDVIKSYIHCQQIRYSDLNVELDIEDAVLLRAEELFMPKMVLLSIVENVFKHGEFRVPANPVLISAKFDEDPGADGFFFRVHNHISQRQKTPKSGFGMKTIVKILHYYFPEAVVEEQLTGSEYSLLISITYGTTNKDWTH